MMKLISAETALEINQNMIESYSKGDMMNILKLLKP